jgi:hypothetical protein
VRNGNTRAAKTKASTTTLLKKNEGVKIPSAVEMATLLHADPLPLKEMLAQMPGILIAGPNCDRMCEDQLSNVVRRQGNTRKATSPCCWQIGCKRQKWGDNPRMHVEQGGLCGPCKDKIKQPKTVFLICGKLSIVFMLSVGAPGICVIPDTIMPNEPRMPNKPQYTHARPKAWGTATG